MACLDQGVNFWNIFLSKKFGIKDEARRSKSMKFSTLAYPFVDEKRSNAVIPDSPGKLLPTSIANFIAYGQNSVVITYIQQIVAFKKACAGHYICDSLYRALINSVLVVCINSTKINSLICSNYAFFENSSVEGTIFGMIFLNLYTKCFCIFFKCMFCFDGFVCCGAFTEVYIGKFRKWLKNIVATRYFLLVRFPLKYGISRP